MTTTETTHCTVCGLPKPHSATVCVRQIAAEYQTLVVDGTDDQAEAWHRRTNAAHAAIPSDCLDG